MSIKKTTRGYQVTLMIKGHRYKQTFPTMEAAQQYENDLRDGKIEKTVEQWSVKKLADYVFNIRWEHTDSAQWQRSLVTRWVSFAGENTLVKEAFKKELVIDYINALKAAGLKNKSVNSYVSSVMMMLDEAVSLELVKERFEINWLPLGSSTVKALTEAQQRNILEKTISLGFEDVYCLFVLMADTGIRGYSEALKIRWDDFTEGYASITLHDTKNNKSRTVPIADRSREALAKLKAKYPNSESLGDCVDGWTYRKAYQKVREATNIPWFTPHKLRHTAATRLIAGGCDVTKVQKLLGHSKITTTMVYVHLTDADIQDVVNVVNQRNAAHQKEPAE